jgi:hypothetical protein
MGKMSTSAGGATNYKPFFLYNSSDDIRNESGAVIAQERVGNLLAIRVEQENAKPVLKAYWRDPLGKLNTLSVSGLVGIQRNGFRIRTGAGDHDAGIDEEL